MVFCNCDVRGGYTLPKIVTILILIDGFLQLKELKCKLDDNDSHNPYFNRWFSAISRSKLFFRQNGLVTILILIDGFLQLNYRPK